MQFIPLGNINVMYGINLSMESADSNNEVRNTIWCRYYAWTLFWHYNDVIMSAMTSQITSLTIVYSAVCSGPDKRKYQRSASLAFLMGIHWWPVNFPHKGPVTRKGFPFHDVIIEYLMRHVTIGLLYVKLVFLNGIFYSEVPNLTSDFICGV